MAEIHLVERLECECAAESSIEEGTGRKCPAEQFERSRVGQGRSVPGVVVERRVEGDRGEGPALLHMEAAVALPKLKAQMTTPLIADIHFDHRLALKAAEVVDCVRINPGNIGAWWKTAEVVKAVNDKTTFYHDQIYSPLVLGRNVNAKNPDFKDVPKEDVAKRRETLIEERMKRMPEFDATIRKALEPRGHLVEIAPAK